MDLSNPSYQSMDCVIKWGDRFISSIRNFSFVSKYLSWNREKTAEMS